MKVLIIEDDIDTEEFLKKRLEEKCFAVDVANSGEAGMRKIRANSYDVILLDYALPNKNGFEIIQETRTLQEDGKKNIPIIMISVTHELMNKVAALEYGADDYLPKPFFFAELFARIQAVLRRPQLQTSSIITIGNLALDTTRQQVTRDGEVMNLTRKEFGLLEYLMKNEGSVVSRNEISEHVWNTDINPFSNTIEMHIVKLRKKIEKDTDEKLIHNIPGRGYSIRPEK
jgi:DNA-binding response OmpR family regulator